ncbi:MAG: HAMP domain-containing sensor histidine kinase [Polyangiaceae bacterium]
MPFSTGIRCRILASFAVVIGAGLLVVVLAGSGHEAINERIRGALGTSDLEQVILASTRERDRMVVVTHLLTAGAVAAAVVVALWLARSLTRPLVALERAARRVGSGDLGTRVGLQGDDELARLGRCFDEMASQLAQHQRRLVESEKLAGIGQLAAGVAHEINNPLAVIRGYATLLARSGDERVAADAKLILDEALRSQAIVAGLLDLARPQQLDRRPCEIMALCREAAQLVEDTAEGVRVEVRATGGSAEIDADKVRQVLRNLLRNAVQASGAGEAVELDASVRDGTLTIVVRDHGPGLSGEARERLFEPFFTTKGNDGTGLGLPLSAAIARAHGGTLEAGDAPGGGARFQLTLPAAAPGTGAVEPEEAAR